MSEVLDITIRTKEGVRPIMVQAYEQAKLLASEGRPVHVIVKEKEDDKSVKQRNYYHGVVLTEISEQAKVGGIRYVMAVWKEFFREMYLGSRWELIPVPGQKRKKRRKVRVSTEELGIKKYAELITKVQAYATTELGVRFSCDRIEDWTEPHA